MLSSISHWVTISEIYVVLVVFGVGSSTFFSAGNHIQACVVGICELCNSAGVTGLGLINAQLNPILDYDLL